MCVTLAPIQLAPIQVFSVEDFGITIENFVHGSRSVFYDLPLDQYDLKKEQIVFLQEHLLQEHLSSHITNQHAQSCLFNYYTSNAGFDEIECFYQLLTVDEKRRFEAIKPYRRRAVSRFSCHKEGSTWQFLRIPTKSFAQTYAKISESHFDFRTLPRIFSEIDEKPITTSLFNQLLYGIAKTVAGYHPEISELDITVHHVLVETSNERITSNSPEGIHQDGFDYIVSALVVERHNVIGGESQIFADDKTTKILTTTLQPGFGILQPDKDTHLWHKVTSILVNPNGTGEKTGFRSSIGFDIALIK